MGEQVDFAFAGAATALPLVRSGKLRGLATTAARRLPALSELPTLGEAGFAGYQFQEWIGLIAPSGTPPEVVARLAREFHRALSVPEVQSRLANLGVYPSDEPGPEKLDALFRSELPRWKEIVRKAGIRSD